MSVAIQENDICRMKKKILWRIRFKKMLNWFIYISNDDLCFTKTYMTLFDELMYFTALAKTETNLWKCRVCHI